MTRMLNQSQLIFKEASVETAIFTNFMKIPTGHPKFLKFKERKMGHLSALMATVKRR